MNFLDKDAKEMLYDTLYDKASQLLQENNPCQYKDGKCAGLKGGCCGDCEYLSNKGCTVKALFCRLWLCNDMGKKYPKLQRDLNKIVRIGQQFGLIQCRKSKEQTFKG